MNLNLKALRTFIVENNKSTVNAYYEADLPFIDYKVKVSKDEQEFHVICYKTGFTQSVAKVFKDKVFFHGNYDTKTKMEIEGSLITSEEYGLHIIEMKKLDRQLTNNKVEIKREFKL